MTSIEIALTEMYQSNDMKSYNERISFIKGLGAKVYRNNKGEHKINTENCASYLEQQYGDKGEEGRRKINLFINNVFGK